MTNKAYSSAPMPDDGATAQEMSRRSRYIGSAMVLLSLLVGFATFLVLTGQTTITPTHNVVVGAYLLNGIMIVVLTLFISIEILKILRSRQRGRAAARFHVRIVALFSLIAAVPAILIAIVASLTLDKGLDRWFSSRMRLIIDNSVTVAQAYVEEHARGLQTQLLDLAVSVDRAKPIYDTYKPRFTKYMEEQVRGRALPAAYILAKDGKVIVDVVLNKNVKLFMAPREALQDADNGQPVLIAPGRSSQVGAVIKLKAFDEAYLYIARPIDPRVSTHLRRTQQNTFEYSSLEQRRTGYQVAFALMYILLGLLVLLSAIWLGIGFADRIVSPVRRLIYAADQVSRGNLYVTVPVRKREGDLANLGAIFNKMTQDLRQQRDEILDGKEQIDVRRRFTEAVLSGVTAGVLGLDRSGSINLVNRSALSLLAVEENALLGHNIQDAVPEIAPLIAASEADPDQVHEEHITLKRGEMERTVTVRVTREAADNAPHGSVVTLDDISELVTAQRTSAWADVARRIAHEIKNPLTPIQLSAERIRRKYGKVIVADREIFDQCVDTIVRQVGDIGRMVDEFSSFARMPRANLNEDNLSDVLKQSVFLMKVGREDITFDLAMPDEPVMTCLDRRLLSQALTNVLKNAAEAIDGREAVDGDPLAAGLVSVKLVPTASHYFIDIIDNGRGLPEDNRQRLLEPYMTTRQKGTGLGLAIVRRIMEEHGGRIELRDAPDVAEGGQGAMIRLVLARHLAASQPEGA